MSNNFNPLVEKSKEEYIASPVYFDAQYQKVIIGPVLLIGGQWGTYIEDFGWFESEDIEAVKEKYFEYCRFLFRNPPPPKPPATPDISK